MTSTTTSVVKLKTGQTYVLGLETTVCPAVNPRKVWRAIARIRRVPPGTQIAVLGRTHKRKVPWYRVRAVTPAGLVVYGWVNSTALLREGSLK